MTNRKWVGMLALGAVLGLLSGAPSYAAVVNPGDTISFFPRPEAVILHLREERS